MLHSDSRSRAWVEVDLLALHSNIAEIDGYIGHRASIMAVIKADAYGHGLIRTAQEVIEAGVAWLGIATVSEGALLREANISAPIALLSAPAEGDAQDIVRLGLTAMVGDAAILDALNAHRYLSESELAVHLDIDTGMGRSGVLPQNAVSLWQHARSLGITVDGISTHYSDAGNSDCSHTQQQLCEFGQTCSALHAAGACFSWTHIDNSASIINYLLAILSVPSDPLHARCNLIRPGLLIYGIAQRCGAREPIPVRPALSLKARIATIRELPENHAIGYGVTHRLKRNSRVATVPIGYGDGYPRALSNRGFILVRGNRAPILGSVCMDQTTIDVTDIPNASAGDEVVCIGEQYSEAITVGEISELIGATEHEITTGLTARLPRVYLHGQVSTQHSRNKPAIEPEDALTK